MRALAPLLVLVPLSLLAGACFPDFDALTGAFDAGDSRRSDASAQETSAVDSGEPLSDAGIVRLPTPRFHVQSDIGCVADRDGGPSMLDGAIFQWRSTDPAAPLFQVDETTFSDWRSAPAQLAAFQVGPASQKPVVKMQPVFQFVSSAQKNLWTTHTGLSLSAPLDVKAPYEVVLVAQATDHNNGLSVQSYIATFGDYSLVRTGGGDLSLLAPSSPIETSMKAGNPFIANIVCDGSLSLYVNGTKLGATTCSASSVVSNLVLGMRLGDAATRSTQGMAGWFGQVSVYERPLTTEERRVVATRIGAEWAIPVAP